MPRHCKGDRMGRALIVVPPTVKYAAGPLLGPALLCGAAVSSGHLARTLDLNVRWLRQHTLAPRGNRNPTGGSSTELLGDHSKPGRQLSDAQDAYIEAVKDALPDQLLSGWSRRQPILTLPWTNEQVTCAVRRLAESSLGAWIDGQLAECEEPDLLGISLLYSGQVLGGLAIAIRARQRWPRARVVLGGAHVSALREVLVADRELGRGMIDQFVIGHAERTFVALLDREPAPTAGRLPKGDSRPGDLACFGKELHGVVPQFDDLHLYGIPRLVLPVQITRGCAYGRCAFCTYGPVEGRYRTVGLEALEPMVELAEHEQAALSFKDSFLTSRLLRTAAEVIRGRVEWAACIKLHRGQDQEQARALYAAGCRTVETGLETLLPSAQRLIDKRQSPELFRRSLASFVDAGINVVVNTMSGFPHQNDDDERRWLEEVRSMVASCPDPGRVHLEHNRFELERLSRFSKYHRDLGIRITQSWPWASVLDWEAA